MENVYTSKIDTWLVLVLGAAAVLVLFAAYAVIKSKGMMGVLLMLPAVLIGLGLPLWLIATTRYIVNSTHLFIRSGPVALQVPVADITAITPTTNPLSSPALSLDRLRIDYGRGQSVMISPRDKEQFLSDIAARRGIAAE